MLWHNACTRLTWNLLYKKTAAKKRNYERRKTAYAQSQNRKVVNEILRHGKHVKTENVSVRGWQKRYGKAISAKSPGFAQSELKRLAENAGGSFTKFSTQKTALSQTHLTGERIKKSLSERVTTDPDILNQPSFALMSRCSKVGWVKGWFKMSEFFVGVPLEPNSWLKSILRLKAV